MRTPSFLLRASIPVALALTAVCGCAANPPPSEAKAAAAAPSAAVDPANCISGNFDIYFTEWEYKLNDISRKMIATAQDKLKGCVIEHVRIVGMADATGNSADNLKVSTQRTQEIADALAAGGWPRSTFELLAAGESGAVVNGVDAPMRRRANIAVKSRAP
jgi:peptidoglycan-associated lipoprotein